MAVKPRWLKEAEKLIGSNENTASGSKDVDLLWTDFKMRGLVGTARNIPWCSGFVGGILARSKVNVIPSKGAAHPKESSQYWTRFQNLDRPALGSIIVFKRNGGGHVGFVSGITRDGKIVVLGGNQSDSVKHAVINLPVVGYYWPEKYIDGTTMEKPDYDLPVIDAQASNKVV